MFKPSFLHRLLTSLIAISCAGAFFCREVSASVAVLSNRTSEKVDFTLGWSKDKQTSHSLEAGDLVPVAITHDTEIFYVSDGKTVKRVLKPNTLHYFMMIEDKVQLASVDLPASNGGADDPLPTMVDVELKPMATVKVMILVDEDEPTVQRLWEDRLRKRVEAASKVFEYYCRVRFEVVAVGTWNSDNRILDFDKSLQEFESEVNPAPARLALGFTSQYNRPKTRRMHLGGTRGALRSHVLIREWSQHVTEIERLEILVHELGHFLGGAHSHEQNSVMRPTLGDQRSHAKGFRIRFDPANLMAMYLVGEELRRRDLRALAFADRPTRDCLLRVYTALAKVMPDDPAAQNYVDSLSFRRGVAAKPPRHSISLKEGARAVVQAITAAAEANRELPLANAEDKGDGPRRLMGDALTEMYVREAAATAAKLPRSIAAKAFSLGLGLGVDRSGALRWKWELRDLSMHAETQKEFTARLVSLGAPTMHDDANVSQRFVRACAMTALSGKSVAESAGIGIELRDAQHGRGFSFNDLTVDAAGAAFFSYVDKNENALDVIAESFTVADFLPTLKQPEEKVLWEDFLAKYGSAQDPRFQNQCAAIRQEVRSLPGYRRQ